MAFDVNGRVLAPRSSKVIRSSRVRVETEFFELLDLGDQFSDFGIQLGQPLLVGLGLLLERWGLGKQLRKVLERLALPAMPWTGMNAVFGSNLTDGFFFLEHFEHHLAFEGGRMPFLFRHEMSSVTLDGLQNCLVFGDHYKELIDLTKFRTRAEAEVVIFASIEIFYKRHRVHSALDYQTPAEAEAAYQA